ncbi:hypothetical protein J5491_00675 [Candidatus Saccharibacteria bacterium]|nr:hypothetical protein [Candidatus Saccharibacteria bacterium]
MDNGQQRQTNPSGQTVDDFFMKNTGVNHENSNTLEPNSDLNPNSDKDDWDQPIERDQRKIGGSVMSSSQEQPTPYPEQNNDELGKIVNLEMPPGHQEVNELPADEGAELNDNTVPADIASEIEAFRAEHDHISPKTLEVTKKTIRDFESGKITPAELDEFRSKSARHYLENSFGRDPGENAPTIPFQKNAGAGKEKAA